MQKSEAQKKKRKKGMKLASGSGEKIAYAYPHTSGLAYAYPHTARFELAQISVG